MRACPSSSITCTCRCRPAATGVTGCHEARLHGAGVQVHRSPVAAGPPGIALSSDFIVGFPGETEEDFERTMALVEEIGFDASFSFVYSRRPGTPAATWPTTRRRP